MTIKRINLDLPVTVPDYLIGEMTSKLAYVDERVESGRIRADGIHAELTFKSPLTQEALEAIEVKVARLASVMVKDAVKPRMKILESHLDRDVPFSEDPMGALLASGEVHAEASGVYVLGPLLTGLIEFFEKQFTELADVFEARPYRFPTLIPARFMERVNYFHAFPHALTFATHLRSDLDVIEDFSEHATCCEHGLNTTMDSFSNIKMMLSPAVCYHLYLSLADKPLEVNQLAATAVGKCFRYESSNLISLERLWDFTMREVIFVGPRDFVLENREKARQWMEKRFEAIGLAYDVESASDPFFIGDYKQAAFQSAFQLKFEIRARLPYKDKTLAVGSYNYHQDFMGRNLNITLPDGSKAHTGCAAFGLERIAFAFLSQYGLDPKKWPAYVREGVQ